MQGELPGPRRPRRASARSAPSLQLLKPVLTGSFWAVRKGDGGGFLHTRDTISHPRLHTAHLHSTGILPLGIRGRRTSDDLEFLPGCRGESTTGRLPSHTRVHLPQDPRSLPVSGGSPRPFVEGNLVPETEKSWSRLSTGFFISFTLKLLLI